MAAQHYNGQRSVGLPVGLDALEHVETPDGGLATDMQCRFIPETKPPVHVNVLRFLQFHNFIAVKNPLNSMRRNHAAIFSTPGTLALSFSEM